MTTDEGFVFTIGLIIVAIGVGILTGPGYGWLTLGGGTITAALISMLARKLGRRK